MGLIWQSPPVANDRFDPLRAAAVRCWQVEAAISDIAVGKRLPAVLWLAWPALDQASNDGKLHCSGRRCAELAGNVSSLLQR